MAIKYRKVLQPQWEHFHEVYNTIDKNLSKEKRENVAIQQMINFCEKSLNGGDKQMFLLSTAAIIKELEGELCHYFINDESLIEFLKSTRLKDIQPIKDYVLAEGETFNHDDQSCVFQFCIQSTEIGITVTFLKLHDTFAIYIFNNQFAMRIGIDYLDELEAEHLEMVQLACNLLLYLKAFPDNITDGVPTDMYKGDRPKYSQESSFKITVADQIVEKRITDSSGRVISPHYRTGHFRHLDSEWYKAKRGSVIFVPATMVKGRAKTVKDPKED